MVVKMMKWRSRQTKKFQVRINVHHLTSAVVSPSSRYSVEIKWRGTRARGISFSSLRKSLRRNFTEEAFVSEDGIVRWNEPFRRFCGFSANKDGLLHPWEVYFTVFNWTNSNVTSIATASLNLADFAPASDEQCREIVIPLNLPGVSPETTSSLHLSILLQELQNVQEPPELLPRSPIVLFPRSPCYGEVFSLDKEDVSTVKASPMRMNIFKGLTALRGRRAGPEDEGSTDGRSSDRSEGCEYNYPLDSDSDECLNGMEANEVFGLRKSLSYGSLAYANHAGASSQSNTSSSEDEDWIYYSHQTKASSFPPHPLQENSKRRFLPWRKRKLIFKPPKMKGEPLLKNSYGDEGGDDIDFDRRQLSSSDESTAMKEFEDSSAKQESNSAFGDDGFALGAWEEQEITSRDGFMKLKTQVFFASIDQRSERASGESACTALVAVIADWLQSNNKEMPIKSQLDTLIREGSQEWRSLCDNEAYRDLFPDKHFDLETVLEANVRPLSVVPEKSLVGFFHPEGLEDKGFDYLEGAMSFDSIWDEITKSPPSSEPLVYIISWNDHFFVLKVEEDAYHIIDTLGERLYEGCKQAFMLKFDRDSTIHRNSKAEAEDRDGCSGEEARLVCAGKECCREYIKSFLAAIPIREVVVDLKKGLMGSTPLHHRLQIEFHYTKCFHQEIELGENLQLEA